MTKKEKIAFILKRKALFGSPYSMHRNGNWVWDADKLNAMSNKELDEILKHV